jgi:hypothetical protein
VLSEWRLAGAGLCAFIVWLNLRMRVSNRLIREFLKELFGLALVRQAKLVASFRVKVPDGRNPRNRVSEGLTNHPYRVLRILRNVASGFDCCKREQWRMSEAYTENHIGHRGFAHP